MSEQRIYKYQLDLTDHQVLRLPEGAEILHVAVQNALVCLWALVDPDVQFEDRTFWIVGTGNPMPPGFGTDWAEFVHRGTVEQGPFVWHVFEAR